MTNQSRIANPQKDLRVSFETDDYYNDEIDVIFITNPDCQAVLSIDDVDTIPSAGDWCVVSVDGDIVGNGDIKHVKQTANQLNVIVPKDD